MRCHGQGQCSHPPAATIHQNSLCGMGLQADREWCSGVRGAGGAGITGQSCRVAPSLWRMCWVWGWRGSVHTCMGGCLGARSWEPAGGEGREGGGGRGMCSTACPGSVICECPCGALHGAEPCPG